MKKILLLLLISISGYSQTLLKLKAIEYAPGAGYTIITNSLGVQTYTPSSSSTSSVITSPNHSVTATASNNGFSVVGVQDGNGFDVSSQDTSIAFSTSNGSGTVNNMFLDNMQGIVVQTYQDRIFTYNGNEVLTTTNTLTLTNKTYSNSVNTGTTQASVLQSNTSAGLNLHNQSGSDCFVIGAGGGVNNTAYGSLKLNYATASTIPYIDASKNLVTVTLGSGLSLSSGTLSATTSTTGLASLTGTETLTNKRITARTTTITTAATITPTSDNTDLYAITTLSTATTFTTPSGTPTEGQSLIVRVKDNGTARALTFSSIYRFSSDMPAPTTTVLSKTMYLAFIYNLIDTKWDCVGLINNF